MPHGFDWASLMMTWGHLGHYLAPSDPCPTDLDRILTEEQDPGAQQYLVLGTVPIKGKKPGVLGAHAFFVLGTVPIKKKTSSGKTSSKQTLQGSS